MNETVFNNTDTPLVLGNNVVPGNGWASVPTNAKDLRVYKDLGWLVRVETEVIDEMDPEARGAIEETNTSNETSQAAAKQRDDAEAEQSSARKSGSDASESKSTSARQKKESS